MSKKMEITRAMRRWALCIKRSKRKPKSTIIESWTDERWYAHVNGSLAPDPFDD